MAESFNKKGFFDCALGNAVSLVLSNVLKVSIVIMYPQALPRDSHLEKRNPPDQDPIVH